MNHLDHYVGPEAPATLANTLKRRYMETPGGYPMFRLVHSEYVLEKIGGEWTDWDESIAVEDRGRLSAIVDLDGNAMAMNRPMRTVVEVRTVPKYSHLDPPGWILERWFPAHKFGSPELYAENVVPGTSIPRLGPYPHEGAYVMLTGPFPEIPSISFLEDFIGYHQSITEAIMDQDIEAYIKKRCYDREQAEEKKRTAGVRDSYDKMMDASKSILFGSSLAAGRLRSEAAEKHGIRSHVGN
ncbi:MAG TPA: hypothetical protein VGU67_02940 [Edaphobacter sp.]|nr:hypothetical protein [Edaphobacter sp.]